MKVTDDNVAQLIMDVRACGDDSKGLRIARGYVYSFLAQINAVSHVHTPSVETFLADIRVLPPKSYPDLFDEKWIADKIIEVSSLTMWGVEESFQFVMGVLEYLEVVKKTE